jgi:hypothetical protein
MGLDQDTPVNGFFQQNFQYMIESKPTSMSPSKKKKQLEEKRTSALKSSLRSSRRDLEEEGKIKEMAAGSKSRANNNVFNSFKCDNDSYENKP